jgi:glutamyl-tRNA synthetase
MSRQDACSRSSGGAVRVRFAPSPTGFLHVGNAKTALVNWLFAKREGGTFILRIEDTDVERHSPEAVDVIFESLRWLGMQWDEGPEVGGDYGPYFQSRRLELYRENADVLVREGKAYKCFCTPEELEEERERARREKRPPRYSGKCRNLTPAQIAARNGDPFVVRFRVPEGKTVFTDIVYGETTFDNAEIGDFVLLKAGGTPTYHLAVVVDDIAMGISHVIRGEGHLSNTPRHVLLYEAFGEPLPQFVHQPLTLGEDGKPLSKRRGAPSVLQFRDEGFLPEAIVNYSTLLGWSPGDDREVLSVDELLELFSLENMRKAAGVLSYKKLRWLNGQHIRRLDKKDFAARVRSVLQQNGFMPPELSPEQERWTHRLADVCQEKIPVLSDIVAYSDFFFKPVTEYDEKGVKKHWSNAGVAEILLELAEILDGVSPFLEPQIEAACTEIVEKKGIKLGQLIHPARLALTGKTVGPGFYAVVELMGKEESVKRLRAALELIEERHVQ